MFTNLSAPGQPSEGSDAMISSLMDTWLVAAGEIVDGRRRRSIDVVKSRGMPHSDVVREFRFTGKGIEVRPEQQPARDRT
jgi:circadian clock protein KaiC